MKEGALRVLHLSFVRWRLVALGAFYLLIVALVANLAFGATIFFFGRGGPNGPARTGAYGSRLPGVAPVDPKQVALAIREETDGKPTIGMPLPADAPGPTRSPTTAPAVISATSTPTYTAKRQAGTAHVPTNRSFPPKASPRRG